ncbi:MAG: hypothetical protein KU29_10660 [Sulfurovum sp. FS06-10]|jgi:hypothetical protein|nr:MAG: hypothetical protein KU29_10660 [Sulfurovum sp. FS06-10]
MIKKSIWILLPLLSIGIFWFLYQAFGNDEVKMVQKISSMTHYEKNPSLKFPSSNLLENGDIIFRRGYGVDSTISMNFSQGEKRYSHAGMIYKTDKGIFIIHAEEDKEHGHNGVYIESIEEFLEGISIWAVYRFDLSKKLHQNMVNYALKLSKKNIIFDMDFNLLDDDKMYCSEFIYKVVNRSTSQELITAGKHFFGKNFVTIFDLYTNDMNKLVQSSHKMVVQ